MSSPDTLRVGVVQSAPVAFNTAATLEKVELLAADAAARGVRLAVFPEAFISAYPKGLDFGSVVGGRTPEGRRDFQRYFDSAIVVPGPETRRLAEVSREHHMSIVIGVIERDGGTLYCTALFFDPEQGYLGKHRKLMPTGQERLMWGFGDGSTMPVFDTSIGRIGAVICWENYMPSMRMAMYKKGIQLYCAPTADNRDSWAPSMQHISVEGRCFVMSACQFLKRSDCPDDYACIQGDDPETILMTGGSCIVNPFGEFLAGPLFNEEGILTADIELGEIARTKYDLDVTGHYSRPDIFTLLVNEAPAESVVFSKERVTGA